MKHDTNIFSAAATLQKRQTITESESLGNLQAFLGLPLETHLQKALKAGRDVSRMQTQLETLLQRGVKKPPDFTQSHPAWFVSGPACREQAVELSLSLGAEVPFSPEKKAMVLFTTAQTKPRSIIPLAMFTAFVRPVTIVGTLLTTIFMESAQRDSTLLFLLQETLTTTMVNSLPRLNSWNAISNGG